LRSLESGNELFEARDGGGRRILDENRFVNLFQDKSVLVRKVDVGVLALA